MGKPGKHDPVVKSSCWNRPFSLGINRGDKMDGIYPDKNGHWVIDKRYMKERIFERTHSANRSFADRILSRRMVEVEEGVYNAWKREFKAVAESWRDNNLPEIQGGKSTQDRYLSIVKCHLVPFFKDKCIGDIVQYDSLTGKNQVSAYFELNAGLPESSLKKHARVLRWIIKSVYKDFELPPIVYRNKGFYQDRFLREDEMLSIVSYLEEQYRPMALFMAYTGLRLSDASSITWREINLKTRFITIRQGKTQDEVKIPIVEKLMDVLKFKSRIQSLHDDRLFQFHLNSFQRAWNRGSEKAGHGWARVHDLRHFFCSFLLNNDVDHMTVATLSGHKALKILKDRYGHYDDQTLERAMSVFDRIVGLDSRKSPAVQK